MSSEKKEYFTKDNLDVFLKELAKEFRKRSGTAIPAEIILIGGAAVLANYGFRDMTSDIDALIRASSSMKDAINKVGDKYNLPNGWLNSDFMHTGSYSAKLAQFSVYYRTFSNILQIRTVSAEYLIAMKLRSGRKYKNDFSDIVGILSEHEKMGNPIAMENIDMAVNNLYGGWQDFPEASVSFIKKIISKAEYEKFYETVRQEEITSKELLIDFENNYPGVVKESNVNDIIESLKAKKPSVLTQIQEHKKQAAPNDNRKKKSSIDRC